ncbi:MAG TPA: hypothetical protein VEU08_23040 [Vicinamibacterales bacterium]|nr:hypothetical protein [Vicinamibacterales bacterium]
MPLRRLTVVAFQKPHGSWVARILEHDMSAETRTRDAAIDLVLRQARAHIAFDIRHGREPLSTFGAAPIVFWDAFHDGVPMQLPIADCLDGYAPIEIRVAIARRQPTRLRLVSIQRTA